MLFVDSAYRDFKFTVSEKYVDISLTDGAKKWVRINAPKGYQYKEEFRIENHGNYVTSKKADTLNFYIGNLEKKLNLALSDLNGLADVMNKSILILKQMESNEKLETRKNLMSNQ